MNNGDRSSVGQSVGLWFQKSRVRAPSIALFQDIPRHQVTLLKAIILGIIQGITEFLPISSSGHLTVAQHFFEMPHAQALVFFDLICHLGTLLAIFVVYFQTIKTLFAEKTLLKQIGLAILPLFPLVLLLKPIKSVFDQPMYVGYLFLLNGVILWAGTHLAKLKPQTFSPAFSSLLIGVAQAVAVLPGISRSGSTISMARTLGWNPADAIKFSFLLAIPTILGATTLELIKNYSSSQMEATSLPLVHYLGGFLTSFIMGYFSLLALQKIAKNNKFGYFAWYSFAIGIITLVYFK